MGNRWVQCCKAMGHGPTGWRGWAGRAAAGDRAAPLSEFLTGRIMKRTLMTVLALASLATLALPFRVEAIPIVSVGSATVGVGDIFTIPVSITDAEALTSFQFDLSFGAAVLQVTLTGVTESAFFTQGDITVFIPGFVDNTNGQILGVSDALIFQSPVSGSGILANIEFNAIAQGTSPLTLSNVFLNLSNNGFNVTNGEVCVTSPTATRCEPAGQVPEPGTLALLAAGLAILPLRRAGRARAKLSRHSTPHSGREVVRCPTV